MIYTLPKTTTICGEEYAIRYDFRVILTILEMLDDADLDNVSKAFGLLDIFYVEPEAVMQHAREAVEACYSFIDMDEPSQKKTSRVMDWEQDFRYIVAPINRVLGYECREIPYDYETNTGGLHWWTFMAAYMEIGGDCTFSQIVSIRDKQARGKKLEKYEKEWLNRNREIVVLRQKFSENEDDLARQWMRGGKEHG